MKSVIFPFVLLIALTSYSITANNSQIQDFDWLNNTIGKADGNPKHFIPVEASGLTTNFGNKSITLDENLLPSNIVNAEEDYLSRNVILNLATETNDVVSVIQGIKNKITSEKNVFSRRKVFDAYTLNITTEISFDGFTEIRITIEPNESLVITELRVDIPIRARYATHYSTLVSIGNDKDIERKNSNNTTHETEGGVSLKFTPVLWIGSESKGIEQVFETNAFHNLQDQLNAHSITESNNEIVLSNYIVNKPLAITTPWEIRFAILPTPVSRKKTISRDTILTSKSASLKNLKNFKPIQIGHWLRDAFPIPGLPIPDDKKSKQATAYRDRREKAEKNNTVYTPYSALHIMATNLPEVEEFRNKWSANKPRRGSAHWRKQVGKTLASTPVNMDSKTLQDFVLHSHQREIKKHNFAGMYIDVSSPLTVVRNTERFIDSLTFKPKHAVVYFPAFELRQFLMRYWNMTKKYNDQFVIIHHGGSTPNFARSFVDIAVFGENFRRYFDPDDSTASTGLTPPAYIDRNSDHVSDYIPDYFSLGADVIPGSRSRLDPSFHALLPQVNKFNDEFLNQNEALYIKWTQSVLAKWLLNDTLLWDTRIHARTFNKYIDQLELFDEYTTAVFSRFDDSNEHILSALYTGRKQALLVLANPTDQPVQHTIDVPTYKLPFKPNISVVTGIEYHTTTQKGTINLAPKELKLIIL